MSQQAIATADLRSIEGKLSTISSRIQSVDVSVGAVNKEVKVVFDELGTLAKEFRAYAADEKRRWEIENATTRLGNARQELDAKFGHYAEVRRTATGILQATDLGIVREEQVQTATEELMLSCPGYWLAPALVALASWIGDRRETAEKALREALSRDDEKTSLFFALVCRRAGRHDAALKWVLRYLANQDPENIGRETVVILDAYAAGLFEIDAENAIGKQIGRWLEILSAKPSFAVTQKKQWKESLRSKTPVSDMGKYPYLKKHATNLLPLQVSLEDAMRNGAVLENLEGIMAQPVSRELVKRQLDDILTSLVTDFDTEELPLRREERVCQLIIDFDGNTDKARQVAAVENAALSEKRDFAQLLTDTAMHPEVSHSSTAAQKLALAYSTEWLLDAYMTLESESAACYPRTVDLQIDSFTGATRDGSDEPELVESLKATFEREREAELEKAKLTPFERYCLAGGAACAGVGAVAIVAQFALGLAGGITIGLVGVLAIIAGVGLLTKHFSRKKVVDAQRDMINRTFDAKVEKGVQSLKAALAEVVDYRAEHAEHASAHAKVVSFIAGISPDECVGSIGGSARKVKA